MMHRRSSIAWAAELSSLSLRSQQHLRRHRQQQQRQQQQRRRRRCIHGATPFLLARSESSRVPRHDDGSFPVPPRSTTTTRAAPSRRVRHHDPRGLGPTDHQCGGRLWCLHAGSSSSSFSASGILGRPFGIPPSLLVPSPRRCASSLSLPLPPPHDHRARGKHYHLRSHLSVSGYLEPFLVDDSESSSWVDYASYVSHLHWMLQKDLLGQDVLLVGPMEAGPHKRRLALALAEALGRDAHVLTITSDLTESDLKQRRELVRVGGDGDEGATEGWRVANSLCDPSPSSPPPVLRLVHMNAAPVDAAIHGHVLILDGLERASRNVLPTLNNLIEHRTMNLEDGRLLVPPSHHPNGNDNNHHHHSSDDDNDDIGSRLVRIHPNFRVVATCVPPGLEGGRALDPPLRSRFQIRRVDPPVVRKDAAIENRHDHDRTTIQQQQQQQSVLRFVAALDAAGRPSLSSRDAGGTEALVPHRPWPVHQLESTMKLIQTFPSQDPRTFLRRFYVESRDDRAHHGTPSSRPSTFDRLWNEIARDATDRTWTDPGSNHHLPYRVEQVLRDPESPFQAQVLFLEVTHRVDSKLPAKHSVSATVPCGPHAHVDEAIGGEPAYLCLTDGLQSTITAMLQAHSAGHDMLLLSPQGEGKSTAASHFCSLLGYKKSLVHCHPDLTLHDLFLRRVTNPHGETKWEPSSLVAAIEEGHVCVLDHVHKLRSDVLAGLQSLCLDRDAWLPDGRRISASPPSGGGEPDGRTVRVHPSFRIIALGSNEGSMNWLTRDVQGFVSTIVLPPPTSDCYRAILHQATRDHDPCPPHLIDKILRVRATLTPSVADDCGVLPLSTRNMIRVARQLSSASQVSDLHIALCHVFVADLLPPSQKEALNSILLQVGVAARVSRRGPQNPPPTIEVDSTACRIGDVTMPRRQVRRPELVPSPNFFDIPSHVRLLQDLLRSWVRGERAFLLLGNQGVGKNMVVDRLCQISNFEREYIQLHRDSTIGQITLQPSLEGGRIVWNDSPLVRAVRDGLVLVVDEADKAPPEVLAVLKGLIEDGELLLGDGRKISRHERGRDVVEVHPDFTLFVLANRPGFPFLGNPFFKQIGDSFETRVVANPDIDSEISLLQSYGPSIDVSLLRQIAASFAELRTQSEYGELAYPYSTREAVAVVKHFERYPEDGIVSALHNVIDFDSFDPLMYATLGEVFQRNGIPMKSLDAWREAIRFQGMQLQRSQWAERVMRNGSSPGSTPPPLSSPKVGKWDEKNEAHVGGNQWAGGTGGSDTAGLGGRGGPYRLDRGHKVHQVSDEAKAEVSAEAAAAARAVAEQALKARLQEIEMSEMEWNMYHRFVDSIQKEIQSLKAILSQADVQHSEQRWLTRQSHGELDEMRLVEGVTGAKNIYKRLGTPTDASAASLAPQRLHLVVDVSGSMYRFNGYDGRLTRCLEATSLVMESLNGYERLFDYRIVGHSGDSSSIRFVEAGSPPRNEKDRLRILQMMLAHSQYCQSGDNTLEALAEAIQEAADESGARAGIGGRPLVIAVSDANLERYGIHPRALKRVIEEGNDQWVAAHCLFLASFGREAESILRELPAGRGHVCYQTSDLPRIVKRIIAAQV